MKKWQWFCIAQQIIGCAGMGVHLFLLDGIKNLTWALTAFACLFGIGLAGNLVVCLLRLIQEGKSRRSKPEKDHQDI